MTTPSKPLAAPQPLKVAFPLGNRGALRSQEGEGFRKEGGRRGGEKNKEERRCKKRSSICSRGSNVFEGRGSSPQGSTLQG